MEEKKIKENQYAFCEAFLALCKEHRIEHAEIAFTQKIEDHSVTWPMVGKFDKDQLQTTLQVKKTFG